MTVDERVRDVLDFADATLGDSGAATAIAELRTRLRQPLRVAIAGRVKAGKSTLLNALIGERLAPTDAGEATRVVTWYTYDESYRVTALDAAGRRRDVRFTRVDDLLVIDPDDLRDAAGLGVGWPSNRLRSMTLIDTPGIGSLTPSVSERAAAALHPGAGGVGAADAVVYLIRHLHPSDVAFLEAFLGDEAAEPTPVNSLAVLSRADEIGGGRPDAMESAATIASRYERDDRVRSLASAVIAVSGLLAETAATLQEREADALRQLGSDEHSVVDRMLLSADLWREPGVSALSPGIRSDLLDRFGMFGLRVSVAGLREGRCSTASDLARMLASVSGLPALRDMLRQRFAGRSRQLVARSVLAGLRAVVESAPRSPEAVAVLRRLEETESTAHEFAELRVLDLAWSRQLELADDDLAELERVTGSDSVAERLGCAADATPDDLRAAAAGGVSRWRRRAGDALSNPVTAMCAETIARSYEGLYQAASR